MKYLKSVKKDGFIFVANDGNIVDRHGERVDIGGMDITGYEKNPVVFFDHESVGRRPVARAKRIWKENNQLLVELEFNENYDLGRELKADVEGGFINALSVGFSSDTLGKDGVYPISELLEISLVGVPANKNSLRVKSLLFKLLGEKNVKDEMKAKLLEIGSRLKLALTKLSEVALEDTDKENVRKLLSRGIEIVSSLAPGADSVYEGDDSFKELVESSLELLKSISEDLQSDAGEITPAELEALVELKEVLEAALVLIPEEQEDEEEEDVTELLKRLRFEKAGAKLSKKTIEKLQSLQGHLESASVIVGELIGEELDEDIAMSKSKAKSLLGFYEKDGRIYDLSDNIEILVYE